MCINFLRSTLCHGAIVVTRSYLCLYPRYTACEFSLIAHKLHVLSSVVPVVREYVRNPHFDFAVYFDTKHERSSFSGHRPYYFEENIRFEE
jgi:hypothetical protein